MNACMQTYLMFNLNEGLSWRWSFLGGAFDNTTLKSQDQTIGDFVRYTATVNLKFTLMSFWYVPQYFSVQRSILCSNTCHELGSCNGIRLYPESTYRIDNFWNQTVASTMSKIRGNTYGCTGKTLFRFVKLIHTLILPFFFGTMTMFDTHPGHITNLMKFTDNTPLTSSLTTIIFSSANLLGFWRTNLGGCLNYAMPLWDLFLASTPPIT